MAFPSVAGTPAVTEFGGASSHSISLPSGIQAGEILLMAIGHHRADRPWSTPSGWTGLAQDARGSTSSGCRMAVFYRVATGSEGSSVTVAADGTAHGAAIVFRVTDYDGAPEAQITNDRSSTPSPPNLAPSWGSADTLWFALAVNSPEQTLSSYPSGYSGGVTGVGTNAGSGSNDDSRTSAAYRQLTASSEQPGSFGISTTVHWIAATVGFKGAAPSGAARQMMHYRRLRI